MCSSKIDRRRWTKKVLVLLLAGMIPPAARASERPGGEWSGTPPRRLPPLIAVRPSPPEAPVPARLSERFRRKRSRETRKERRRRACWGVALALSSGLAAWWSKERADRAYTRYLRSAGVRRQRRHFERAERFDRIAGAAFAGMEAGIGWATYFLFFE